MNNCFQVNMHRFIVLQDIALKSIYTVLRKTFVFHLRFFIQVFIFPIHQLKTNLSLFKKPFKSSINFFLKKKSHDMPFILFLNFQYILITFWDDISCNRFFSSSPGPTVQICIRTGLGVSSHGQIKSDITSQFLSQEIVKLKEKD